MNNNIERNKDEETKPITLKHLQAAFYILFIGYFISSIIFFIQLTPLYTKLSLRFTL